MSIKEEEKISQVLDSQLIKRLFAFLLPYKWKLAQALLFLVIFALCELAGPYLIKIAIDKEIAAKNIHGLALVSGVYLIVITVQFIVNYLNQYITQWLGQHVMYDIRKIVYDHIQKLPLSYFDKNPVGRLVTRLTNDIETLNEMLSSGVVSLFGDLFVLIGIIAAMLHLNWKLALLTFAIIPFIFYASFLFRVRVRESFRKIRVRIAKINTFLQENLSGMAIVQLFNRQAQNETDFKELNKDHMQAHIETIRYFAIYFPTIELLSTAALALIIWYGGVQVFHDAVTLGVVVAFIQYAQRFFQPIRDLSDKYNILQSAMASSERIFQLLDTPIQQNTLKDEIEPSVTKGKIEFRNVNFSYKENEPVLKNVSFTVEPGEKIAIVGATGSGKTTLTSLLTRMYEVIDGTILIDDQDISQIPFKELRNKVGTVQQDNFIFTGSIRDNIQLENPEIDDITIQKAATNVNAAPFIEKLPKKYDHNLYERGSNLSMGQKQLLSFARALAYDPDILIMDEATSNVDTETELLIRDAIQKLLSNRTSIIIAHRLSTIQFVDRIIVMHKGEIREMGTHDELVKLKGIYHRLSSLQFDNMELSYSSEGTA